MMLMEKLSSAIERYRVVSVHLDKALVRLKSSQDCVEALMTDRAASRAEVQNLVEQHVEESRKAEGQTP